MLESEVQINHFSLATCRTSSYYISTSTTTIQSHFKVQAGHIALYCLQRRLM
jgi:hypothetical protein